jgi:hypothetical protein
MQLMRGDQPLEPRIGGALDRYLEPEKYVSHVRDLVISIVWLRGFRGL